VLSARPEATGIGLDFGDEMLRRARERFAGDPRVEIDRHDLDQTSPGTLRPRPGRCMSNFSPPSDGRRPTTTRPTSSSASNSI